jgi:hypothetical protein
MAKKGKSPFRFFQRHKQESFAILGVFVIFAFVVLPALQKMGPGSRGGGEVFVTTEAYGDLTTDRVGRLRSDRAAMGRLASALTWEIYQAEGNTQQLQQFSYMVGDMSDRGIVHDWLLLQRALELKLTVDDAEIQAYLSQLTDGKIPPERLAEMVDAQGMNVARFKMLLRNLLLTRRARYVARIGMDQMTPADFWNSFQLTDRRVNLEAAAVPVDQFLDLVQDPGDEVLEDYFDRHKYRVFNPNEPDPGFRRPTKIAVEYIQATDEGLDLDAITMEEIEAYYEENKDVEFVDTIATPAVPDPEVEVNLADVLDEKFGTLPGLESNRNPEFTSDEPEITEPEATEPEATEPEATEPEATETEATEPEATEPEATETEATETEATETEATETEATETEATETEATETSMSPIETPFQFASFQDELPEDATEEESLDVVAEDIAVAEDVVVAEDGSETATEDPAFTPLDLDTEEPVEEEILYRPLEDVEARIRRTLAVQKSRDKLQDVMASMQTYLDERNLADQGLRRAPDKIDLSTHPVLELPGFTYGSTSLLDQFDFSEETIGQEWHEGARLSEYLFQDGTPYVPITVNSGIALFLFGGDYALWITEREEESEPVFGDKGVRAIVLHQWKMQEARSLAIAEAERLAKEVRESAEPMKEVLADEEGVWAVETTPFSCYTQPIPNSARMPWDPPEQPEISMISEQDEYGSIQHGEKVIVGAGRDFMHAVNMLDDGQVGVSLNHPQTSAYVLRVEVISSPGISFALFQDMPPYQYLTADTTAQPEVEELWGKSLEETAGLEWVIEPRD